MGEQNFTVINLDGGLNLVDTHYTNQQLTGTCKVLDNYESTINGGYRRIEGFTKYGTAQPSGSADNVLGVFPYADGIISISSTGVYFSTDGITWVQVNRDTYTTQTGTIEVTNVPGTYIQVNGVGTTFTTEYSVGGHILIGADLREIAAIADNTDMTLATEIAGGVAALTAHKANGTGTLSGSLINRTGQGVTEFAWLEADGEYGSVVMTDTTGSNDAARLQITGSGGSRVYFYDSLDTDSFSIPATPRHCTTFEQRVVVAYSVTNGLTEAGTVTWSDRYQNQRFDGASAGSIQVDSPVVAIKPFRDRLIIFCKSSIYQLSSINDSANLQVSPVSYTTGCAAAGSVQEIAGDVLFLSYDGVRTITSSDKYGDINFGIISDSVDPLVKDLVRDLGSVTISSCIVRTKNQYRLFYTGASLTADRQHGLIGTFKKDRQGNVGWQWSRAVGIPVAAIASDTNSFITLGSNEERIYHGGYDGYIYQHDTGDNFDGSNVAASFELNEVDYGDVGLKKTLHYIKAFGNMEGSIDPIDVQIKYDYNSSRTMQPTPYMLALDAGLDKYGVAVYGTATYGGGSSFVEQINVAGSGFSNNFSFSSEGLGAPFTINSLYIDVRLGVKQ